MSRLFGPMRQIGYIVHDIEKTMLNWSTVCTVGPWFYFDKGDFKSIVYNGKNYNDIHISMAFANSGDIQIELIQQRCNTPSMYREFLANGSEGMHHWSSWPENYDELYKRALECGYTVWQEGLHARGPFVYFKNEGNPGAVIEMSELTPGRRRFFNMVREAAIDWDGRDPVRRI